MATPALLSIKPGVIDKVPTCYKYCRSLFIRVRPFFMFQPRFCSCYHKKTVFSSNTLDYSNSDTLCIRLSPLCRLMVTGGMENETKTREKRLKYPNRESIKAVREQMGLTQERFAELVNVTAQYISDVERGVVGISIATLKRIREVTAISSDSILMGKCDYNDITLIVEQLRNVDAKYINPLKVIINKYLEAVAMSNQNEQTPE